MKFRFRVLSDTIVYSGRELRSGWVARTVGLDGDAAAAFVGPCSVANDALVDLDDARDGASIEARSMAHVLLEHPGCDIRAGVLRQRLLVCILCESLSRRKIELERRGDDVFVGGRKLTVSIAAPAPNGVVIHLGVNVDAAGAPVAAVGLEELGVRAHELLAEVLEGYKSEVESATYAETKVRAVE